MFYNSVCNSKERKEEGERRGWEEGRRKIREKNKNKGKRGRKEIEIKVYIVFQPWSLLKRFHS